MASSSVCTTLVLSAQQPSKAIIATISLSNATKSIDIQWSQQTIRATFSHGGVTSSDTANIVRHISRAFPSSCLYGSSGSERSQIDSWLDFFYITNTSINTDDIAMKIIHNMNKHLALRTYLVGQRITTADLAAYCKLADSQCFMKCLERRDHQGLLYAHVSRWFLHIAALTVWDEVDAQITAGKSLSKQKREKRKEAAVYVDLPGAEKGKVITRFPPEASGYLHVGHVKAALLNDYYAQSFEGEMIFRFDDTNPAKENSEFEAVIEEDVKMLQLKVGRRTRTSDHFDLLLQYAETLIREGKGYIDNTPSEQMASERMARIDSKCRTQDTAQSMYLWEEMKKGSDIGRQCVLRGRIDMKSNNGALRDPVFYRCKPETHPHTGDKYKVYPTYDFACPIVDSVEGVTHALRTTEYVDRDDQYKWVCDAFGLRIPHIYSYARLNLQYTLLSKRKLTWFVDNKYVMGWDDPRMPTVRGILRRGLTLEGLNSFIVKQGSSVSSVLMNMKKIWALNKQIIDPFALRYVGVHSDDLVEATVLGTIEKPIGTRKLHPKDDSLGSEPLHYASTILLERKDVLDMSTEIGKTVTMVEWGNMTLKQVEPNVILELDLSNVNYKNTKKFTWLAKNEHNVTTRLVELDNLISSPKIAEGEKFEDCINPNTWSETPALCGPGILNVKKGDIIQILRKGFFICDKAAVDDKPALLFLIPSGSEAKMGEKRDIADCRTSTKNSKKTIPVKHTEEVVNSKSNGGSHGSAALNEKIVVAGNRVRTLKADKADKTTITEAVSVLKALKAEFKAATDTEWAPSNTDIVSTQSKDEKKDSNAFSLNEKIVAAGDHVRSLKADKADKATIMEAVDILKALKAEFKVVNGAEWIPDSSNSSSRVTQQPKAKKKDAVKESHCSAEEASLRIKVGELATKMRDLKAACAPEEEQKTVTQAFNEAKNKLMTFSVQSQKKEVKEKTSHELYAQQKKLERSKKMAQQKDDGRSAMLGIYGVTKASDLSEWYSQVISKAELIEYYDVSGCYILRPAAYSIWETIKSFFDTKIKELGIENCYFPIFVSRSALEREKDHVEDFAPEVAWVTRSGDSDLAEPIAIRPTSETVMYPSYSKWIQSHRDLPLRLNQWNNVIRWEFKHPQPFLRTREFLWQEGHSAFATPNEAKAEVLTILDLYGRVYEDLLAVPVVRGRKSEKEKFAGADYTTTVEAFVPASGRGIQGATSHHLGQRFARMFDISFQDPSSSEKDTDGNLTGKSFVYQNSWGITTRTIGVMVMVHGDDKGIVLPPRVASIQSVVIPCGITAKTSDSDRDMLLDKVVDIEAKLREAGVRTVKDLREGVTPGFKFNHWELRGIPLRVEVGFRDLEKKQVTVVRRDNGKKVEVPLDGLEISLQELLETIQQDMYNRALTTRDERMISLDKWDDVAPTLNAGNMLLIPFCGDKHCEEKIKADSANKDENIDPNAPAMGAKSLCIPFSMQDTLVTGTKCLHPECGRAAVHITLFGRSY